MEELDQVVEVEMSSDEFQWFWDGVLHVVVVEDLQFYPRQVWIYEVGRDGEYTGRRLLQGVKFVNQDLIQTKTEAWIDETAVHYSSSVPCSGACRNHQGYPQNQRGLEAVLTFAEDEGYFLYPEFED